jgi:hypothetical protein
VQANRHAVCASAHPPRQLCGSFLARSRSACEWGGPMHSLNGDVEHWLTETPLLPTPAVLLAGLVALNIVSAVLALLAA